MTLWGIMTTDQTRFNRLRDLDVNRDPVNLRTPLWYLLTTLRDLQDVYEFIPAVLDSALFLLESEDEHNPPTNPYAHF